MNNYNIFEAKEYFNSMLKEYLTPTFKDKGYKKVKNYWKKMNGEVNITIKLEKSRTNTKLGHLFWFSITVSMLKNNEERIFWGRQDNFLTSNRVAFKKENHQATEYLIFRSEEEYNKMLMILKTDFEDYIFPLLDKIDEKELEKIIQNEKEKNGDIWYVNEFIGKNK